jgi:hypothetical protein
VKSKNREFKRITGISKSKEYFYYSLREKGIRE